MARQLAVDISLLGDKKLERSLRKFEAKVQKRLVKTAQRKGLREMRKYVTPLIRQETGNLRAAMAKGKVKAAGRSRNTFKTGLALPTRQELGIAADDRNYYPASVEYGHKQVTRDGKQVGTVKAYSFARRAANEHGDEVLRNVTRFLKAAIEKEKAK